MNKLVQGCVAEFLGTFALVFFGCASIIVTGKGFEEGSGAGLVTIALAHGLILAVSVSAAMYISGGQFNPAVSIGVFVAGKQPLERALAFIGAQVVGAVAASAILLNLLGPELVGTDPGSPQLGATIGYLTRFHLVVPVIGIEGILTFALVFVVLAAAVDERAHKTAGLQVGLTVAACICAAGPLTGASMNPARSFGPALVGGHWIMHWAYWVGPLAGATAAALVYREVWSANQKPAG